MSKQDNTGKQERAQDYQALTREILSKHGNKSKHSNNQK